MSDEATNVASATGAQPAALKSTDTLKTESKPAPKAEAAKPAKPEVPGKSEQQNEAKPEKSGSEAPPEGEQDDAPAAAAPERKEQRLPRWMKERLERERQVTAARTREQVLRELQQGNNQPAQPQHQNAEPQGEREKTLADFDFDPVAYQKYLVQQGIESYKREEQTRAQQAKQAEAAEQFKAKIDAFEAKVGAGAWEDIESSRLNADPAYKPLCDLFLGDEHDLDIAHHLVQHPEEADRLLALPPLQRVRELAKLADQFSDEPPAVTTAAPVLPPKKTTNAPPPPKTVSGAGKPAVDVRSPEISTADRIAAWKAGKR
jgi:hypothetical protein